MIPAGVVNEYLSYWMFWATISQIPFWNFREFIACCGKALEINDQLIKEDQRIYQEEMKKNYTQLKAQLAKYIGDEVCF